MSDLRKSFNNRNVSDENNNQHRDYAKSLAKHKAMKIRIMIIIAIVAVIVIVGVTIYRSTLEYDSYKTEKTLDIDDGAGSQYVPYGQFFVRYGLDGISYLDGTETVWSQAYEMSNPMVDVCESYVAVADKGKNTIYIFNETGNQGVVTTSYPILRIEVANQGVVAALLEEDTANYIEVYDKDGEPLISHKTLLGGSGYPLSFSLSDDGTKMIVSYVSVNSGTMESSVLFYNFSGVGQNEVDRMVGGFNHYESTIIPTVKFLDNNIAVAVGDDVMSIYKMREKPSLEEEIEISGEIKKVFYNEKYIGFVYDNTKGKDPYRVEVYSTNGSKVMDRTIDMDFDIIKLSGKNILIYDDMSCKIIAFNGNERFEYRFKEAIVDIMPTEKFREYLIITNNTVKRIKIK